MEDLSNMTTSEFRDQFFALCDMAQKIVITSHMSPDDDSIGSVLILHRILSKKYSEKSIRILYSGNVVNRWHAFDNFEKIEWVDDIALHSTDELLVMLDASQHHRCSRFPEKLTQLEKRIVIDHHASDADEVTLIYKDIECTSNCELLYRIFLRDTAIDRSLAELLLLGVLGDTGGFRHLKPTQFEVMIFGKMLMEIVGISIDEFQSRYGGIPVRIMPLLQELAHQTTFVTIEEWPPLQYTYLSRQMIRQGNYTDEEISAASHIYLGQYLPRVKGYDWGFVITPRSDTGCRISSRSLPTSINVRKLHEHLGVGGGHDRASGGSFKDISEPTDCITHVLEFMKTNKPLIG